MSWRLVLGLPFAGAVVMALFLWMSGIISVGDFIPDPPPERPELTLPEVRVDSEVPPAERPDPTKIEPPEQPELTPPDPLSPPTNPGTVTPKPTNPAGEEGGKPQLSRTETPGIRQDPTGFERCFSGRSTGTEEVVVAFDIAPDGQTSNVRVVSSTDSCFDRSAKRAVEGWRYNPRMERGEAVWRYGRQTTIVFQPGE